MHEHEMKMGLTFMTVDCDLEKINLQYCPFMD